MKNGKYFFVVIKKKLNSENKIMKLKKELE